MNRPRLLQGRKLLVASLGVAAVNYAVACNEAAAPPSAGNLMPSPHDTTAPTVDASAAGATGATGATTTAAPGSASASPVVPSPTVDPYMTAPVSGNLMPSPPRDADAGSPRRRR